MMAGTRQCKACQFVDKAAITRMGRTPGAAAAYFTPRRRIISSPIAALASSSMSDCAAG